MTENQTVEPDSIAGDQLKAFVEQREVWLPVPGYEGHYEISNFGRVKGKRKEYLTPALCEKGYKFVTLSKGGNVTAHRIHVLVLTAFCGERPFSGAHAAHNDGDRMNCRLSNLRWATPKENQADVDRHGRRRRGEDIFGAVLDEEKVSAIRSRLASGERNRPIAEDFGVSISTINLIRHNRIWRHVQ